MGTKNKNVIKTILVVASVAIALGFRFSSAQSPREVNISAYLVNSENKEITNGEYDVRFALYAIDRTTADPYPSTADSRIWEETQKIKIQDGFLSAYLGAVTPIPASINFTRSSYYLGIRIGTDSEMFPRKRIGSVPLAIDTFSVQGYVPGALAGNLVMLGTNGKVDIKQLPTGTTGNKLITANNLPTEHDEVTLTGSYDYLTLSGQEITLDQIDLSTDATGTLAAARGGTGITSYTAGDLIYASGAAAFSKLGVGAANQVLTVSGGLPSWQDAAVTVYTAGNDLDLVGDQFNIESELNYVSTITRDSSNLTLSTTTSGTLSLTSAGALNFTAGANSTWTLPANVNALNIDSNTLSIDASNNYVGIGTNSPGAKLDIVSGNLDLDNTTNASQYGIISKNGTIFIHNFNYGNNGSVTTEGYNTFVGESAGNLTMGSSAYMTSQSSYNSAFGANALTSNTTGNHNTAAGAYSLYTSYEGHNDSAFGAYSMYSNTTGWYNSAFGSYSLYSNTYGDSNSAFGYNSLYTNNHGTSNSAFGKEALYSNINGSNNAAFGREALYTNTGSSNSAFGASALKGSTSGGNNSAFGTDSMRGNTDGQNNSAFGQNSLVFNDSGDYNSAFGSGALYGNISGNNNVSIGYESLNTYGSTASNNTAVGYQSGKSVTSGGNNVFLGYQAGYSFTDGTGNIFLGYQAGYNETGSNKLYIENSNSTSPLIWGDFSTDVININGSLGIGTTAPTQALELGASKWLSFEGATDDAYETILQITDTTGSDKTIIFPNENGTVCTTGSICSGYQASMTAGNDIDITGTQIDVESQLDYVSTITRASNNLTLSTTTSGTLALTSAGALNLTAGAASTFDLPNTTVNALSIESGLLSFDTNNSRVGIGTTAPEANLEIYGADSKIRMNTGGSYVVYLRSNGGVGPFLALGNEIQGDVFTSSYVESKHVAIVNAPLSGNILLLGGNVGIGTNAPEGLLEIQGAEGTDSVLYMDADDGDDNADTWILKSLAADNDFTFTNHASELMRLTDGGNLGVGSTNPSALLHLNGSNVAYRGQLSIQATDYSQITFYEGATTQTNLGAQIYWDAGNNLFVLQNDNGGSTGNLLLNPSGGNVGIGMTAPDKKLILSTTTNNDGIQIIGSNRNSWFLTNETSGTLNVITQTNDQGIYYGGATVDNATGFVIAPWRSDTTGIRMDSSGNVGIMTASPLSKLNILFGNGTLPNDVRGRGIISEYYGVGAYGGKGGIAMVAGGTKASPSTVVANDAAFMLQPLFYDGTKWRVGSTIGSYVTAATNNTSVTSELRFFTGTMTGDATTGGFDGFTQQMVVDANGNVGIGTTAPGSDLTIANGATSAGVIQINEDTDNGTNNATFTVPALAADTDYILPADDGDAGEFLQTNGSGTLSWEAVASGMAIGDSITSATQGSILFAGALGVLAQDNANFFWDDGDNHLGIGTTDPGYPIHVVATDGAQMRLAYSGSYYADFTVANDGDLTIAPNDAAAVTTIGGGADVAVTIDNNGKMGIGTTAPSDLLDVSSSTGNSGISISRPAESYGSLAFRTGTSPRWYFGVDAVAEGGANAGTNLMLFSYDDAGTPLYTTMEIFRSNNNIALLPTGNGRIGVGTTDPGYILDVRNNVASSYVANFFNDGNNANRYGIRVQGGADDSSGTTYYLSAFDGDGTAVGYLQWDGANFQAVNASDRRLKTNIQDTELSGLDIINNLRVVDFNWKQNPDGIVSHGFIAQEVQEVFPYMVSESPDGMLTIGMSSLIPVLTKAVQEQQASIANQENLISTLNLSIDENINSLKGLGDSVNNQLMLISESVNQLIGKSVKIENEIEEINSQLSTLNSQFSLIATLQSQMEDIKKQTQANTDLLLAMDPQSMVYKDVLGNVDLLKGKLTAEGIVAGAFTVKVTDEDKKTIGEAVIKAGDSKIEVVTKAVSQTAKIFTSFGDNPDAYSWIEKKKDNSDNYTGFEILLDKPAAKDIEVNWWIVEEEQDLN